MLAELRIKNCFVFDQPAVFSMESDMRNKRLTANICSFNYFNLLKSAGIYGMNNSGKTCLIRCLAGIRDIMLGKTPMLYPNRKGEGPVCELGVTFIENRRMYSYDVSYHTGNGEFPRERFSEIMKDRYGNQREVVWYLKDYERKIFLSKDSKLADIMPFLSKTSPLFLMADEKCFPILSRVRQAAVSFASQIDILDGNKALREPEGADWSKSAQLLREKGFCVRYPDDWNSHGAKKALYLTSCFLSGRGEGRLLAVDGLDCGLHFQLSRFLVELFHSCENQGAQLIFTLHDISLMDCRGLFRKEQIWFIDREEESSKLYSLAGFTASMGIRETSDIIGKYKKGVFGAVAECREN